jgi:hypothetical protein
MRLFISTLVETIAGGIDTTAFEPLHLYVDLFIIGSIDEAVNRDCFPGISDVVCSKTRGKCPLRVGRPLRGEYTGFGG